MEANQLRLPLGQEGQLTTSIAMAAGVTKTIVESVKAAFETFLDDFTKTVMVGDRVGAAIASSQISQLGLSIFEFFGAGSESLCTTTVERTQCHEAAIVVRNLMDRNLETWDALSRKAMSEANQDLN